MEVLSGISKNHAHEVAAKSIPFMVLFVLSVVFFHSILAPSKILNNIHYINDMTFGSEHMRGFLHEGRGVPLWTPYFYAGQPFIAVPEHYIFDLNFLYVWALDDVFVAMDLALISYFFLAGVGMFLLIISLLKKQWPALLGAVLYMLNGFVTHFIIQGHLNLMEGYALIPFAVLLVHKAIATDEWVMPAAGAGILLGMMVLSGSIIFLLYTILIIGVYAAVAIIGGNVPARVMKIAQIGVVVAVVLFGISAIKLLPTLEFAKMSSRAAGVSFQEFLGYPIELGDALNYLILIGGPGFSVAVGFSGILLVVCGLLQVRRRPVMFASILCVVGLLLASGSFLAELFYHLPGMSQMRHIERALVLVAFAAPLVAAYGAVSLTGLVQKKYPFVKETVMGMALVMVVLAELLMFQPWPQAVDVIKPLDIPLIAEVAKDKGMFKVATHSMETPIGASGYNYYAQLGIPEVKGGGGIWIPEYVQFLAIAQQQDPAALFGVLGAKYIITSKELQVDGLELRKKFDECKGCTIWEAYGPYLYENKKAVPEAFVAEESVLLVGSERSKRDASYALLSRGKRPTAAIIMGKENIAQYAIDELQDYDSLLLLENSVAQSDAQKLQQFVQGGGIIVPDILKGETSLTEESLAKIVDTPQDQVQGLPMERESFNSFSVEVKGQSGWLVLSERIAYFPGWSAQINEKYKNIERANAVVSAVHLDGKQGMLKFSYKPASFRKGMWITSLTVIALIALAVWKLYSIRGKNQKEGLVRALQSNALETVEGKNENKR